MSRSGEGAGGPDREAARALLALSLRPDSAPFARAAAAAGIDWGWLLDQARAHKVEALIAARLAAGGLAAGLDADLRARIEKTQCTAGKRAATAERTLAMLAEAFGDAGVPYFVVKGSVLAHEVYGVPQRRLFADIDVVVRAADMARAEAILQRLGYRFGLSLITRDKLSGEERAVAEQLVRRFAARHLAAHDWYAPPGSSLMSVDLHWRVTPDRLPNDEETLWTHLRSLRLGSNTVRTLSPPAALLHLAAHATRIYLGNFRLLHLCDLAWAADRYADDLPATWQLADRWRMRPHLERVFAMVEDVLDVPMPRHPRDRSRRDKRPAVIDRSLLLDAPQFAQQRARTRLGPELRWALALRCLHVNLPTIAALSLARARLRRFRRRQAMTGARPS